MAHTDIYGSKTMTSTSITLMFIAVFLGIGAIAGGILFIGIGKMLRLPIQSVPAFGAAFAASCLTGAVYARCHVGDGQARPVTYRSSVFHRRDCRSDSLLFRHDEIVRCGGRPDSHAVVAHGFAAGRHAVYLRTDGTKYRENQGFYRGYEKIAYLNLPDPPDAMVTPEKAVNYYNQQVHTLRTATEDSGIGKILPRKRTGMPSGSWITGSSSSCASRSRTLAGATKVVTDPAARKALAMAVLAKPLYGEIEKVFVDGNDALVQMSSGQLARLLQRRAQLEDSRLAGYAPIHDGRDLPASKNRTTLMTDEDRLIKQGNNPAAEAIKQLAARARRSIRTFRSRISTQKKIAARNGDAGWQEEAHGTGYAQLDAAKPGELVDLTNATPCTHRLALRKPPAPSGNARTHSGGGGHRAAALTPAVPPQPTAVATTLRPSPEQQLALANQRLDAASANNAAKPTG